jgi:hypothetical protein
VDVSLVGQPCAQVLKRAARLNIPQANQAARRSIHPCGIITHAHSKRQWGENSSQWSVISSQLKAKTPTLLIACFG